MFTMSGMIPKVPYANNFPYSFAENFLHTEQKIVDLKGLLKTKENKIEQNKINNKRELMFTCLFVCFSFSRFLQVTCVDALWSRTSSRKLEIFVELQKEGV